VRIFLLTASPNLVVDSELQQQLQQIKHQFADAIWRSFILIALIGAPLSISRALNTGWLPIYTFHLVIALLVIAIALVCRHLSLPIKAGLLLATFWLIGLPGIINFGMASPGIWWLVLSCLVAHVLYSVRVAIRFAAATLLALICTAIAYVSGLVQLQVDANLYLIHPASWATYIIVNSVMFFVVIKALLFYNEESKITAKHQFRQWIDDLPIGVLVTDCTGKTYYQNHLALTMFGSPQHNGTQHQVVIHGTDEPYPAQQMPGMRALRGETCVVENIEIIQDGERRQLQAWGRPGFNTKGELAFGIASFQDITEYKRLAQLKNQFVSTVSHELRTPLTAIRGALGLILGNALGEPPPQMLAMLQTANQNSQRLLTLVNDILDLQKVEANQLQFKFQQTDLAVLLTNAVQELASYAAQHQVTIELALKTTDTTLTADPDRLMQVVANLLSNAAKFSPAGGRVLLVLELLNSELLRLSVTDQGSGISESFKKRIFEPFSQSDAADNRERGGTGLGLTISKAIVDKHHGQISYVSTAGQGSCFIVDLPRHQPMPLTN